MELRLLIMAKHAHRTGYSKVIGPNYIIPIYRDKNKCIIDNYHITLVIVVVQIFDLLCLFYAYLITIYCTIHKYCSPVILYSKYNNLSNV